ncbi:hypothetical protein DWG18_12985 [Lysobacter sp. TY2-98]|uniref:hypothetical protein n=1 Tax=Lysobacter sp. TY2-98 TaxID=2290922 RepID=UPI000E1FC10E|nr:hypothetical protein [Lysobacter sp. TY2-98]AXK73101.1 hypothetical protein DWG18_12985 [Lysobacter sp. TY2-98]
MSYVIEFLERAGRGTVGRGEADKELSLLPVDVQAALLAADEAALAAICGLRTRLIGYVSAPDREPLPDDVPDEVPTEPDRQEPDAA